MKSCYTVTTIHYQNLLKGHSPNLINLQYSALERISALKDAIIKFSSRFDGLQHATYHLS